MNLLAQESIQNPVVSGLVGKSQSDGVSILGKFFSGFVGLLLVIGAVWSFVQILLGALAWISSGGDKGKLEAAQQKIVQAIIGLILVFAAWAIFFVLLKFLGVSVLSLPTLF